MDLLEFLKQQARDRNPSKDGANVANIPGTPTGVTCAIVRTGTAPGTPNPRKTSTPTMGTSPIAGPAVANTPIGNPVIAPSRHDGNKIKTLADAIIELLEWQRWRMETKRELKVKRMVEAQRNRSKRNAKDLL
jgi:hypothetical protein